MILTPSIICDLHFIEEDVLLFRRHIYPKYNIMNAFNSIIKYTTILNYLHLNPPRLTLNNIFITSAILNLLLWFSYYQQLIWKKCTLISSITYACCKKLDTLSFMVFLRLIKNRKTLYFYIFTPIFLKINTL